MTAVLCVFRSTACCPTAPLTVWTSQGMLSLTPPTSIFFTCSLWLSWFRSYSLLPQVAETRVCTHTHTHKRVRTHRLNPFTCMCVRVCRGGVHGSGRRWLRGGGVHLSAVQHAEDTPGQVRVHVSKFESSVMLEWMKDRVRVLHKGVPAPLVGGHTHTHGRRTWGWSRSTFILLFSSSVLPDVTSGWQLLRCVKAGMLPFLRSAALFFHYLNSTTPPADLLGNCKRATMKNGHDCDFLTFLV